MNDSYKTSLITGKVTLVGAGPGDPELLTRKAYKALQSATVLFVDDLVNPEIVELANPVARVVYVGKRGGCKSTPQAFIEKLMVAAVADGANVVRLKGGDPFIFGRGGEEVEALQRHGIAVEVINGITAGLAAVSSLNVPLTHREYAHGVVFITGHAKTGAHAIDWREMSTAAKQAKLTLVIYMGVSGVAHVEAGLLVGLPPDTPVAIVQNASLPSQRHVLCALHSLRQCVAQNAMTSPSVIIVGEVFRGLMALSETPLVLKAAG